MTNWQPMTEKSIFFSGQAVLCMVDPRLQGVKPYPLLLYALENGQTFGINITTKENEHGILAVSNLDVRVNRANISRYVLVDMPNEF